MPTTVIETIAKEIVRRSEQITIANGYTFDVAEVVRPDRVGVEVNPVEALIVVRQGDSVKNAELSCPGNPPAIAYDTQFEIECFVRLSDYACNEYQEIQSDRGAQIVKAITIEATDTGRWFSFEEKAINTELGDIKNFETSEGNHNGVTVAMTVTYRVDENNPYNARS
jgi:hypothetical protein